MTINFVAPECKNTVAPECCHNVAPECFSRGPIVEKPGSPPKAAGMTGYAGMTFCCPVVER
jgi:hypothetical protein